MWGSLASEYDYHSGNWIWSSWPYASRLTAWAIFYGLQQSERGFTFEIITTFWLCWMEDAYQVETRWTDFGRGIWWQSGRHQCKPQLYRSNLSICTLIWINLFPNQKKEKKGNTKKCVVLFCFFLSMNCFIYCTDSWFCSWTFIFFCQTV